VGNKGLHGPGIAVAIPHQDIAEFCRRHQIRRLSLVGSILREDFRPGGDQPSDVDFLVEFEPGHSLGWEIVDIEAELSRLVGGRRVDMVNPKYLNRRLKDRVLASARPLYEFIQVIGEAARRVSPETRALHPEVPESGIIGMRPKIRPRLHGDRRGHRLGSRNASTSAPYRATARDRSGGRF
jgi:predicted nucleotidyltransferase